MKETGGQPNIINDDESVRRGITHVLGNAWSWEQASPIPLTKEETSVSFAIIQALFGQSCE